MRLITFNNCINILCFISKTVSIIFCPAKFAILIYMDIETLLKNTSRSLYLSVRALPRSMRPAFGIAYLLCRYADTIADTPVLPSSRRLYWIERFPHLLKEQDPAEAARLAQEISGGTENPYEAELVKNLMPCLELLNNISSEQRENITDVVYAVCEGMKTDLSFFPNESAPEPKAFDTPAELERYCRLMGGKPGLFWSRLIYGTADIHMPEEEFYELGQHIGDALQIVNILRDLPKDLRIGRCYFPRTDLEKAGLTAAELLDSANSARFEPVKRKWIAWGLANLKSGKKYFPQLPKSQPGQRAAVAWPILWTADTFFKVYREPDILNPAKRVKISRSVIYSTMLVTPPLLASNTLFCNWLDKKLRKFK